VSKVEPGSPAEKAGIKAGDVIVGFDGTKIERLRDLTRAVADVDPGKSAKVELWRDGKTQTVNVAIGEMPGAEQVAADSGKSQAENHPRLGLALAPVTPDVRQQLGLAGDVQGVLVQQVEPGSPAEEKGIQSGDIILQVAGKPVSKPQDVANAVQTAHDEGNDRVLMLIRRGGNQLFTAVPFTVS
jgi:serine protease Do